MIRLSFYTASFLLMASCTTTAGHNSPAAATSETPSYERVVAAARANAERGHGAKALELADRAIAMEPNRSDAYLVRGLALAQANALAESAAAYEKARELGNRDRRLFLELTSVYDVAQEYDRAVAIYNAYLVEVPDDSEMRHQLALTLLLLGRAPEAVKELQRVVDAAPNALQPQMDLGYALFKSGKGDAAARTFEVLVSKAPDRRDLRILLARSLAAAGKTQAAVKTLTTTIEERGADATALRMRARLFARMGKLKQAAADYQRVLDSRGPIDPAVRLGFAGVLIELNQLEAAEQMVQKASVEIGEHPFLDFRRAQISWRRGDRNAVDTVVAFARDTSDNSEAWRDALAAANRFGDARLKKEAAAQLRALDAP